MFIHEFNQANERVSGPASIYLLGCILFVVFLQDECKMRDRKKMNEMKYANNLIYNYTKKLVLGRDSFNPWQAQSLSQAR